MSDSVLSVRHLSKSFGALKVSDDVSFDVRAGEIHAIIGPNGAGKTTLIQQISGALRPDTGTIILNGSDISKSRTKARARAGLGRTFQISALCMESTVLENALLGAVGAVGASWRFWRPVSRDEQLRSRAEDALSRVGLVDLADVRCANLSHGQRRQLEVAVALTLAPRVFLMDEPMAGLGASGTSDLIGFLDELRHEAPILLVEHDMDAVFALADRISVLVYGRIIASGTPAEVRANGDVQSAYLGETS